MKPIPEVQYNYLNYNSATLHNKEYNAKVQSILEDYFSPEELKSIDDYILVGEFREDLADEFTTQNENQENITKPVENIDLSHCTFFSSYEKMLFSHFFHGKLLTYIISGAMGSGKTTTLNYILKKVKEIEKYKDAFIVKLDFAKGYGSVGSTIDEILSIFNDDFYKKIKAELVEEIHNHGLSTKFILEIKKRHQYFSDFYDLSFDIIERNNKVWEAYPEKEKVFEIFKYIENETYKGSVERLNLVMYFVNFISDYFSQKEIPVLFVYDNIDKLPPSAQRAIFINVLAFNAIAQVRMVFTMRRSTKAKIHKVLSRDDSPLFENRAQYPFAHIYHHGPSVSKVYKSKLEFLINNFNGIKLFNHFDENTKNLIVLRAKEVLEKISQNSTFKQAFNGISGQSKRLALTIANRPFCNNIVNYDSNSHNLQSLVRTLYSGMGENMRISLTDKYVCNIYSNKNNQFTLINYIILYIFEEYSTDSKFNYLKKVDNLHDFLFNYLEFSNEEIISALNFLLSDKRALLGGEYFPKYDSLDDILKLKDNLRITELGDRYYNTLTQNGSIYNQVCLLSLKWKGLNEYTYKNDSIAERFSDLRFCISLVRDEEEKRFKILKRNSKERKLDIKIEPISDNLVKLFSSSFIGILPALDLRDSLKNEVLEWKQLIIYMNYLHGNLNKEERDIDNYCRQHGFG